MRTPDPSSSNGSRHPRQSGDPDDQTVAMGADPLADLGSLVVVGAAVGGWAAPVLGPVQAGMAASFAAYPIWTRAQEACDLWLSGEAPCRLWTWGSGSGCLACAGVAMVSSARAKPATVAIRAIRWSRNGRQF